MCMLADSMEVSRATISARVYVLDDPPARARYSGHGGVPATLQAVVYGLRGRRPSRGPEAHAFDEPHHRAGQFLQRGCAVQVA